MMTRIMQQIIAGLSSLTVALSPVFAVPSFGQGISGAGANAPEVLRSANNTPLVMIETPNGAGVSHNTYGSFDIDNRGAILNNIDANYDRTQLGGYVQGNANLTNGPASVIINEVISNKPSDLRGYLEVGGTRADVVVANPYGITCDGCGFINTDRATVTTGVPQLGRGGALNSIDVSQGHVQIGKRGLDATGVSQFDLLSRTVKFAGAIYGQNVRVVAGRNNVIYATGKVEVKGDEGGEAPAIAIDSTVLGGMYANKITINSTERGVGVRAPETMAANAGEMHITADGRLVMGQASARRVRVQSRNSDVEIRKQIAAAEQAEVQTARDLVIAANGRLVSDAALSVRTGRDVVLNNGAVLGSERGAVSLNATGNTRLGAGAQLVAAQNLTLQSKGLRLASDAVVAAGRNAAITSDVLALNGGVVQTTGDLNLVSDRAEIAGGTIEAGRNLNATIRTLTGQDYNIKATGALTLEAGTVALGEGQIVAGDDVILRGDDLSIGGVIGSRTGLLEITTRTGDLAATGTLSAARDIRLASAGATELGHVQAGEALAITSAGDVTGLDAFSSTGMMEITTGGSLRGLALHAGVDVLAKAAGDILIGDDPELAGSVLPYQQVEAPDGGDGTSEPVGPDTPDSGPDTGETATAAPPALNDASGEPGEEFAITPGLRIGDVWAGRDIDLTAGGRIVIGNSAVAERDITLDAGKSIDISAMQLNGALNMQSGIGDSRIGKLTVTGDFALDVDGRLALDEVTSPGSLTLTAGHIALGGASSGKDLVLTAVTGDVLAKGDLLADGKILLDAAGSAKAGRIVAQSAVDLETGEDFAAATVQSGSTISIDAGGGLTSEGLIEGDTGVTLISGGQLSGTAVQALQGRVDIDAGGDVTLAEAVISGAAADIASGGALTLNNLQSGADAMLASAGDLRLNGTATADGAFTVTADGQFVLAGADVADQGRQVIANEMLSITAAGLQLGNYGQLASRTGNVTLRNRGASRLGNGATIVAAKTLSLSGTDLTLGGNAAFQADTVTLDLSRSVALRNAAQIIGQNALDLEAGSLELAAGALISQSAPGAGQTAKPMSVSVSGKLTSTSGTIQSAGALELKAGEIVLGSAEGDQRAALLAEQDLTITTQKLTAGANDLLQSNTSDLILRGQDGGFEASGGLFRAAKAIDAEAGRVTFNDSNLGAQDALSLTATSGDLAVRGTANAAAITMTAAQNATVAGRLASSGAIRLEAEAGDLRHSAEVTTPDTLTLLAGQNLMDTGRGILPENAGENAAHLGALTISGGTVGATGDYLVAGAASITSRSGGVTTSGRIVSGATLKVIAAAAMLNTGTLTASDLGITADGIDNRGDLTGANSLALTAKQQSITNSGTITAGGTLVLDAKGAIVNKTGGEISAYYDISTIKAASLNNAGTIGLKDARFNLAGDLRNSGLLSANTRGTIGGTLINKGEIKGGTHALRLANLNNSGQFRTDETITLTMSGSDIINSGVLHAGQGVVIKNADLIRNVAGAEISGGTLKLDGENLNNAGEIIATRWLQIDLTDRLTNSGVIQNGADLGAESSYIKAGKISNSGDIITDQGKLTLTARESFTNSGKLSGRGVNSYLAIRANALPDLGKIAAEGTLELANVSGGLLPELTVKSGEEIVTQGALYIKAAKVTNAGGIAGLGGLTLEGNSLTNTGILYSEADMKLLFRDLINNDGGTILIADGGLTVTGRGKNANGSDKALTRLVNQRGGTIQTLKGDMSFNVTTLENLTKAPVINTEVMETSEFEIYPRCRDGNRSVSGSCTSSRRTNIKISTDLISEPLEKSSQILSGGNIQFKGETVQNSWGKISAAKNISVSVKQLLNEGTDLIRKTETEYRTRRISWSCYRSGGSDGDGSDVSCSSSGYEDKTSREPDKIERIGAVFGTIQAGGVITGIARDRIDNKSIAEGAVYRPGDNDESFFAAAASNTRSSSTGGPLIGGDTVVTASMLSFTPDGVGVAKAGAAAQDVRAGQAGRLQGFAGLKLFGGDRATSQISGPKAPELRADGFVNLGAIGNDNLFVVNQNPNAGYLVETRYEFIDQNNFLSSDYFLDALNFDPEATQIRLGDAMVETWLIRDQLFNQTGRNLLVGQGSEYDQLRAMYDNAAAQARALGLVPGVALTASQVKALTSDIVWLEEHTVSGRKVLIPRVYLTEKTIRANAKGAAQILGDAGVNLKTGKLINNGGAIGSTQGQTVIASAGDIRNDYGLIFGGKNSVPDAGELKLPSVVLSAEGNYTSTSGLVTGEDIVINATDILIKTDVKRIKIGNNGNFADVAGPTAGIRGTGTIALNAVRDIRLTGADLDAGSDVTAIAGGDIELGAIRLETELGDQNGNNYSFTRTTNYQTSDITAGGNVVLASTGTAPGADGRANVTLQGSDVNAGGTIGIIAQKGDVQLLAVQDELYSDEKRTKKKWYKKKSSRNQTYELTNNTTSLNGESIDIYADGNVRAEGTQFTANGLTGEDAVKSGGLRVTAARGDIDFVAVEDIRAEKREKSSKFLGGLISSSSTKEDVLSDMQGVVTKTTGDVDLSAVQGSVLLQGGDYTGVGGKVNVTAKQTYLQGVVDSQYSFEQSNDNNGFVITDKTRVTVNETADAPRFNDGALTINGDLHVGGRDGSPQLVRGAQIETLGPQGILAAQNAGESSGEGQAGGEHWTKGFTDQYEGDANIRQVALTDVTGPGTGYLNDLNAVATGDVTYGDKAELLDVQYQEVTKQAGVLTKAIIAVASGGNAWLSFGLNTVADAAISGEIDLENILKDAAFTYVTAGFDTLNPDGFQGITGELTQNLQLSSAGLAGSGYFSPKWLATTTIDTGVTSVAQTAIYGGSLGDNIKNGLGNSVVNEALALTQSKIRGVKSGEGTLDGMLLHGFAGCAASAAQDGGCAEGFVAAAGAEFATGVLHRRNNGDTVATAEAMKRYGNPLIAAVTSGGDVNQFSVNRGIADSKLAHNYLNEAQRKEADQLLAQLQSCLSPFSGNSISDCQPLADKLGELQIASATNTLGMLQSCRQKSGSQACERAIAEARAYLDWSDGFGNLRETWFNVSANQMSDVEVDWGGNLDALALDVYNQGKTGEAAYQEITGRAISYDGRMNLAVGGGTVGVSTIACVGSAGAGCLVAVGLTLLSEANNIYDGTATLITKSEQKGAIQHMLEAGDLSPAQAKLWEDRVELGLSVVSFGVDGAVTLRNVSKVDQMLDDVVDYGKTDINPLEIKDAVEATNSITKPTGVPDTWTSKPTNKGGGTRYSNPDNPHDFVRVMPGNPNSPNSAQQQPYVIRSQNGRIVDVNGNPVASNDPAAHIPLSDFEF